MRILSITAQKPDSTGSGIYLSELVHAFAYEGHEQAVVCGAAPEDCPERSLPSNVLVYAVHFETADLAFRIAGMSDDMPYPSTRYCDFDSRMLKAFKTAFTRKVMEAVCAFKPDLIICHHLYIVTAVVTHLRLDCPVVGICHGTCLRQLGKHDLDKSYICEGVRLLDHVFVLTDVQKQAVIELIGKGDQISLPPISVLGTGYNSTIFHVSDTPKPQKRELLYVGKIADRKGVSSLLRAVDMLPWQKDELHVNLVGGGSEEHAHIVRAAKESRFDVSMPGKMDQKDLAGSYQRAHVFVLPSFYEGLPLVIAEALACGCVVVCTDLPGVRDWLLGAVPDAPVIFVTPPRMKSIDVPFEEDLPRFEQELSHGIVRAFEMVDSAFSTYSKIKSNCTIEDLSWNGLASRLLNTLFAERCLLREKHC